MPLSKQRQFQLIDMWNDVEKARREVREKEREYDSRLHGFMNSLLLVLAEPVEADENDYKE